MRAILRAAGDPHRAYASILIAGTNGKGSVAATLSSIVRAAEVRSALYTSPHLERINERWRIDEDDIDEALLDESIGELRTVADRTGIRPTYFEALTLVAFVAFRRAGVDLAVLEVGMGGRLDATNVVRPVLALITTVGLDHQEFLGRTIAGIAREKAGIIHRGSAALTTVRDESALRVIERRCRRFDVPLHRADLEVSFQKVNDAFKARTASGVYHLEPQLEGAHQMRNLALAIRAAESLPASWGITRDAIERGVSSTRWPARAQELTIKGRPVLLDGAHNVEGMRALEALLDAREIDGIDLVFAAMADKDWRAMLDVILPRVVTLLVTRADEGRGEDPSGIAAHAQSRGVSAKVVPLDGVVDAVGRGSARHVVIAGSLYLAGAVLADLRTKDDAAAIASKSQLTPHDAAIAVRRRPKRR